MFRSVRATGDDSTSVRGDMGACEGTGLERMTWMNIILSTLLRGVFGVWCLVFGLLRHEEQVEGGEGELGSLNVSGRPFDWGFVATWTGLFGEMQEVFWGIPGGPQFLSRGQ